jgi:hypothetical protein
MGETIFGDAEHPTVGQAHRAAPEALRRKICSPSLRPHQTGERVMSTRPPGSNLGPEKSAMANEGLARVR